MGKDTCRALYELLQKAIPLPTKGWTKRERDISLVMRDHGFIDQDRACFPFMDEREDIQVWMTSSKIVHNGCKRLWIP